MIILSVLHKQYIKFQASMNAVLQDNAAETTNKIFFIEVTFPISTEQ